MKTYQIRTILKLTIYKISDCVTVAQLNTIVFLPANTKGGVGLTLNPCPAELLQLYFSSFEAGMWNYYL